MTLSDQAKEVAANHFLSYYPQATGAAAYDAFMESMEATEGTLVWQPHVAAGYDRLCELMEKLAINVQFAMDRAAREFVIETRGGVVQNVFCTGDTATVAIHDYDELDDDAPEVVEFAQRVASGELHRIY